MTLSGRARAGLNSVVRELNRQPVVEKSRGKWVEDVVAWCHQQDIDLTMRISNQALRFDATLMAQINSMLESDRLAPLGRSLSGLSSAAQAAEGVEEDKSRREGPRAKRVLINLPPQPSAWLAPEPRSIRDVDVSGLKLSVFGALVQVENLDSFYAFSPEIAALSGYANPLVVYRGDSHYGGGFAELTKAWRKTNRPHLYAGDFDAKGVTLALDSGATHLLLPDIEWLTQHVTPLHQPAEQLPFQRRLRQRNVTLPSHHPLRPYLALLEKQRGLKQQWFGGEQVCVSLS
ncbi:hypothetical protein CUU95_02700 [Vreelandella alkaliphila]|uniref:DUF7281 domain-containing protein n=1 Tax=Vreelandella alkaliphila TaxID=272774 RepID=UPI000EA17576|nr:hypothetical protein [Halomonas alkaliphila]AYF32801.1 hypothetical protein CUU95_02700 [Halomonas alkaliphila]